MNFLFDYQILCVLLYCVFLIIRIHPYRRKSIKIEEFEWFECIIFFFIIGCISIAWTFVLIYYSTLLSERSTAYKHSSSHKLPIKELITKAPFW